MNAKVILTICGCLPALTSAIPPPPLGPCAQDLQQFGAAPGSVAPQCTQNGWFQAKQCTEPNGYCWCVNPETNLRALVNRQDGQPLTCPKCFVDKADLLPIPGTVGGYVPQCDENGYYLKKQVHGGTGNSWCADPATGVEIFGTKTGPGSSVSCP